MDLGKVLAELKSELANLDAAIVSLERLQAIGRKRAWHGSDSERTEDAHNGDARDESSATPHRTRDKSRKT